MSRDDVILGGFDGGSMFDQGYDDDDDPFEDGIRMTDRLVDSSRGAYSQESGFNLGSSGSSGGSATRPAALGATSSAAQETPPVMSKEYWTQMYCVVPCFFTVLVLALGTVTLLGFETLHPLWGLQAVLGIIPGFLLMYFFYWRNDRSRAQLRFVVICFVTGALCAIPAALVEMAFDLLLPKWLQSVSTVVKIIITAVQYFLIVAVVEELSKYLAVQWISSRPEYDDAIGAVIYAVSAALGFATLENVGYVISTSVTWTVPVAIFRALMAVPLHTLDGVIIGVGMARRDFFKESIGVVKLLSVPVLIHGAYDFLLALPTTSDGELFGFLGAVIVLALGMRYASKQYSELRGDLLDGTLV